MNVSQTTLQLGSNSDVEVVEHEIKSKQTHIPDAETLVPDAQHGGVQSLGRHAQEGIEADGRNMGGHNTQLETPTLRVGSNWEQRLPPS